MIYSNFYSLIHWIIQSRWSTYLYNWLAISNIVNICIQQIYNEYRWSFLYNDIIMNTFTKEWDYYTYDLSNYPIKTIMHVKDSISDNPLYRVNSFIELDDDSYLIRDNKFYVTNNNKIYFHYYKWYTFKNYNTETSLEIPLEDKMISALYYLVLSQLDQLYVLQNEWEPRANFNKYQYEIENVKKDDMLWEAQLVWTKL